MLKQRALSATLWSGSDALLSQGLQFIVSIILARLLGPEEYGTIALLSLFTGLATLFVNSGSSSALIQRQDVTHTDESTVFWFNVFMGAVVALLLLAAAPAIAVFFAKPVLVPLTTAMALNVFLNAIGSIHRTRLTKRLEFRTLMKVNASATVVGGTVGVLCAVRGLGVWALAFQAIASTCTSVSLLWLFGRWRPALVFSALSAKRLFSFGGYLLAASLLDVVYSRMYTLLIGRIYGARQLGLYNRAEGTKQIPTDLLTDIVARVTLPVFSATADDPARLRRGLRLAISGVMLINVPVMLGLSVVAEPLVLVLFGGRWLPAVPILRVLAIAGLVWPLQAFNSTVLVARGSGRLYFRLEVIKKVLGVILLSIGTIYGVMGIAWSQVAAITVSFLINAHYTNRLLSYGPAAQVRDVLPILSIAVPMSAVVYAAGSWLNQSPFVELPALAVGGTLVYVLAARVFRIEAFSNVIELLQSRRAS